MANFRSSPNQSSGQKRHKGAMNVSGSVRGHELFLIHGASNLAQSAEKFLPMGYGSTETTSATYLNRFIAPSRGRWVKSYLRTSVAADTTTLKLYKAIDGTANPATLVETVSVECSAGSTTYEFDSTSGTGDLHFAEGDVIAFRLNPETQPDLTNFTHVIELYTRVDIP